MSFIRNRQSFANFDGCRFARAIRTEKSKALTGSDFKVEIIDGNDLSESLPDPTQEDRGRSAGRCCSTHDLATALPSRVPSDILFIASIA